MRHTATERFLRASIEGDLAALLELLAPDATLWADGGGKAKAPLRPIHGADKIARFFVAIAGDAVPPGSSVEIAEVNEGPAAVLLGAAGALAVLQLDLGDDGRVTDLRLVGNPDKLTDLAALRGRSAGSTTTTSTCAVCCGRMRARAPSSSPSPQSHRRPFGR